MTEPSKEAVEALERAGWDRAGKPLRWDRSVSYRQAEEDLRGVLAIERNRWEQEAGPLLGWKIQELEAWAEDHKNDSRLEEPCRLVAELREAWDSIFGEAEPVEEEGPQEQVAGEADNNVGRTLAAARKHRGLTLREVEKRTGIANPHLSQIERGTISKPSARHIWLLSDLYELDTALLMEWAEHKGDPVVEAALAFREREIRELGKARPETPDPDAAEGEGE